MKAAIYVRVSTDMQNSDSQEKICKNYCKRMDIDVFKVYRDVFSGASSKRPAFNEMLKDMRAFEFDVVVCTKLDRMGRSLQHLLSLIEEFKNKKVDFVCVTQNIDTTTSAGKLQMQIMGAFAEFERNIISERTKEALRYKKNVGKRGKDKKPRDKSGYYSRWRKGGV